MGATHTTHSKQTQKHKGVCCVTCVLARLRAHYTTHANPKEREEEKKSEEESSVRRWMALVSLTLRRATT